jgi:peroxiredoxin
MLHTFIRGGHSFSGRERNCCFLNLGPASERFADVSNISGFDFPDDGRALARVDWDRDGDLDFWVANRSGPQIRFLRNDIPVDHHHLTLRLIGTTCNRDAIGARIELVLASFPEQKHIKTLRAGDGFLAQSTKWMHFGLGRETNIDRLRVRWPDGNVEEFTDVRADARYVIKQGTKRLEIMPRTQPPPPLQPSKLVEPAATKRMRVVSTARLPVPSLEYRTFEGQVRPVTSASAESKESKRSTLVVLWASWCAPCLDELREITTHAGDLRGAGLDVVALSVDPLAENSTVTSAQLKSMLERFDFPFASGVAPAQTVAKLQLVHDRLFDLHRQFPIPVSFLINDQQELTVLYRGRVDVDQLLKDARRVRQEAPGLREESTPFTGRWLRAPNRISPFSLAWDLLEKGHTADGMRYVDRHRDLLGSHIKFPRLVVLVANAELAQGNAAAAIKLYRDAVARDAHYVDARNNLAWVLSTHPDASLRNGQEAVEIGEAVLRQSRHGRPEIWDTLAAAYAEAGLFDKAIAAARKGIELARRSGQTEREARMASRLELYENGQPYRIER